MELPEWTGLVLEWAQWGLTMLAFPFFAFLLYWMVSGFIRSQRRSSGDKS